MCRNEAYRQLTPYLCVLGAIQACPPEDNLTISEWVTLDLEFGGKHTLRYVIGAFSRAYLGH